MTKEERKKELLKKHQEIKNKIWDVEQKLKDKSFVSSIDFSSMYPSIIRLLNASIENLVGFLDDDPIANRKVGQTDKVLKYAEKSKELLKGDLAKSKFKRFVSNDERLGLRLDLYHGKFDDAPISEITETPFERFFLALMWGDENETFKFQGKTYTAQELQQHFKENHLSVSGSGAVFKAFREGVDEPSKQGLIPSYLSYLFKERKKVKKEMLMHYKNKTLLQKLKMAAKEDGLI